MKKEENAMVYTTDYQSPLGTIFLAADEKHNCMQKIRFDKSLH